LKPSSGFISHEIAFSKHTQKNSALTKAEATCERLAHELC